MGPILGYHGQECMMSTTSCRGVRGHTSVAVTSMYAWRQGIEGVMDPVALSASKASLSSCSACSTYCGSKCGAACLQWQLWQALQPVQPAAACVNAVQEV